MSELDYDVIVVGAGMFGSSAAKHIRRLDRPGRATRLAVIGPSVNTGELCRGQHYDEARICRRVEMVAPWALLDNDGLASYRETEKTSGIPFYTPCGVVWVAGEADKYAIVACMRGLAAAVPTAHRRPFHFYADDTSVGGEGGEGPAEGEDFLAVLSCGAAAERHFGSAVRVAQFAERPRAAGGATERTYYVVEKGPHAGGTVHPTNYVRAQLRCAALVEPRDHFTHIDDEVVVGIACVDAGGAAACEVRTDTGRVLTARKVLVATASYASYHNLIPKHTQQLFRHDAEHVVLLRVTPPGALQPAHVNEPLPEHLKASEQLPCVIRTTGTLSEQFYCLPPRYYRSVGKEGWFIKMGGMSAAHTPNSGNGEPSAEETEPAAETPRHGDFDVSTLKKAMDWYNDVTPIPDTFTGKLIEMLPTVYPDWRLVQDNETQNTFVVRCVWDRTADRGPVIDRVSATAEEAKITAARRALAHAADSNNESDNSVNEALRANAEATGGLFMALGGNGRGAKACDPIGQLAALRLVNGEDAPLPGELSHYEGCYYAGANA